MGLDEVGTLRALKAIRRELADPAIADDRGRHTHRIRERR
jgi:adenylate cyclase